MHPDETRLTGLLAQARHRLLDTRVCPACGRPLLGQGCAGCGLDVSGGAGLRLWDASLEVVRALEEREALISTVRTAQRSAPPAPRPAVAPTPVVAYQPPALVRPPAVPRAPWRVQTVLQVLGVALLATASIVFLIFSWNVLSVAARGTVIGLGTVVVLALAAWLLRRGLDQSAQAVGALGVVLVLLDAWAVHATGLAGPTDPAAYAAAACVVCAGLLGAYGAATGVRAGTVATAVLLPLAPLMLLGHTTSAAAAAGLLLSALALATLRFVPGPRLAAERATLTTAAVVSAVAAALTGVLGVLVGDDDAQRWASTGVLLGVALVCAVQAVLAAFVASRAGRATTAGHAWSFGAGILAAVVATAAAALLDLPPVTVPAAVGVLLGVVVAAWPVSRTGHGLARAGADGATLGALVVGVPTVLVLLAAGAEVVADPTAGAWSAAWEPIVGSIALVVLLAVLGRRHGSRVAAPGRHGAATLAAAVVLVGAPSAGATLAADPRLGATAALLTVATVTAVLDAVRRGSARWYLRGTALLAVTGALAASIGLPCWTGAALATAALLALSVRRWGGGTTAAVQSAVVGATLGWAAVAQLAFAAGTAPDVAVSGASALAVAVLTVVALASRLAAVERHTLLALAGALGAAGWVVGVAAAVPAQRLAPVGVVTLLVAAVVWIATVAVAVRGRRALTPVAAQLGTALVAPVGALAALSAQALTGVPGPTVLPLVVVVLGGVAVVAAGLVPRVPVDARPALELSGWAVVALGQALATAHSADLVAVALLLAAVVAVASAARPDRRDERWLALGLVVMASWCSLGARGVGTPEAYLAPLGVVLAVVGARRWRRGRPAAELLGGGLALLTLPVAVVDDPLVLGATELSRTALACVLAAVLVAAALVVARRRRPHVPAAGTDPLVAIAALAALIAVLAPGRTAAVLAATSWTADAEVGVPVELWALAAAAILAGAAVAALRAPVQQPVTVQRAAVWTVLLVATIPAVLTHDDSATGLVRILVVGLLGTWLAARGADRSAAVPTAWTWSPDLLPQGLVLIGAATQAALLRTWPVPYDATLAVTGAVLVLVGVLRLRRDPQTGTWLALGPGLVGLLALPTFTALATGTPWRVGLVVGGGLLAVGAGARWRWQAPFVVGAAALVLELVAQLLPVTRAALGDLGWWPVLAVGGAALLGLGLTYERRLRDAREAARYVAAMR